MSAPESKTVKTVYAVGSVDLPNDEGETWLETVGSVGIAEDGFVFWLVVPTDADQDPLAFAQRIVKALNTYSGE